MLIMDSVRTCYVAFKRSNIRAVHRYEDLSLSSIISKLYRDDICYDKQCEPEIKLSKFMWPNYTSNIDKFTDIQDMKLENRCDCDIFKFKVVDIDLDNYNWRRVPCTYDKQNFINDCNKLLVEHGFPEISYIYNTKEFIEQGKHLHHELYKTKRFSTHVILKDSIEYVSSCINPKPILQEVIIPKTYEDISAILDSKDVKPIINDGYVAVIQSLTIKMIKDKDYTKAVKLLNVLID